MDGLTQWKLNPPRPRFHSAAASPALKWALAALVVLGLGFGIGRVSAPTPDLEAIRAAIEAPIRTAVLADARQQALEEFAADWQAALNGSPDELRTESRRQLRRGLNEWTARTVELASDETQHVFLKLAESSQAERQRDQANFLALFDRAQRERQDDYLSLRQAVETVAVMADDKFNRTESELGQFVSYAQLQSLWEKSDASSTP